MLFRSPQQFGNYHLLEKIATGGMAEVWRARAYGMAGFEKILVIKKVLDSLVKDEEFVRLFIDEARIGVQLHHVNIVQVFDLGQVDGTYYMAMEYVHGLDLSRLLNRAKRTGVFPVGLALFVIAEVLKALQFAHTRTNDQGEPMRIVHCDISPQNVLVSYAGEVKITDFGISRASFQATTQPDVIRGKYAYMSPEQVDGKDLDGRSDVFSLGIVLYELLTGRRLFKAKTRDETLARVRRGEVPSPRAYRPEISEDLEAILLHSLAPRRKDRYASAAEMLDAINRLMVSENHRATNNDLAAFMTDVVDKAGGSDNTRRVDDTVAPPTTVVVLAAEASPPPRSLATPRDSLEQLTQEWAGIITAAGGEVWEDCEGGVLAVWTDGEVVAETIGMVVDIALDLKERTEAAGYRMSAGVAPGVARLHVDDGRPPEGWELSGPFYLVRWMMNLSAHRGRLLLTEVGAKRVGESRNALLGRVSIQGNRYINLYELI